MRKGPFVFQTLVHLNEHLFDISFGSYHRDAAPPWLVSPCLPDSARSTSWSVPWEEFYGPKQNIFGDEHFLLKGFVVNNNVIPFQRQIHIYFGDVSKTFLSLSLYR